MEFNLQNFLISGFLFLNEMITLAPFFINSFTIARPISPLAPVINAILPLIVYSFQEILIGKSD